MIVGGFSDIDEEGSYGFAGMNDATSNSGTEFAVCREPTDISPLFTTTRAGFTESQKQASVSLCLRG